MLLYRPPEISRGRCHFQIELGGGEGGGGEEGIKCLKKGNDRSRGTRSIFGRG